MDRGRERAQTAREDGFHPASPKPASKDLAAKDRVAKQGPQPELDLERLIWDPEYRRAMRPWMTCPS
jgi:hypothetical protein